MKRLLASPCIPTRSLKARAPVSMAASAQGARQSDFAPKLREGGRITFEDIATFPRPGCSAPDSIAFSPDDRVVTYLASADGSLTRQLYAMDIATGEVRQLCKPHSGTGEEDNFSLEEKLRRERSRQLHTGITSYAWAKATPAPGLPAPPTPQKGFNT